MGLCPKPRKFFEKNLTKNFHTGKVFGLHSKFDGCIPSCHPERRAKPVVELRRSVRSTGSTRGNEYPSEISHRLCLAIFVRVIDEKSILTTRDPTFAMLGSPTGFDCVRKRTPLKMTRVVGLRYHKTTVERIIRPCHPERNEVKSNAERDT